MSAPLVAVRDVSKDFGPRSGALDWLSRGLGQAAKQKAVRAVDNVSLSITEGEVVGLVGESGCGKSTLARMVAGLSPPSQGAICWRGENVATLTGTRATQARLRNQMIFQDPMASLNPRMRIRDIVGEAPLVHKLVKASKLDDHVDAQMERVGLNPSYKWRYPHQLSGGQRQRASIARALAVAPQFLVCDESVAALDVSIQAQVLNLLMRLRRELALTYLFISHDLGIVRHISDRVLVMYLGRIVEELPTERLYGEANHPYTQSLLSAIPRIGEFKTNFPVIKGEAPSPIDPPSGCHFHPRCSHASDRCQVESPALRRIAEEHFSACHLNEANGLTKTSTSTDPRSQGRIDIQPTQNTNTRA